MHPLFQIVFSIVKEKLRPKKSVFVRYCVIRSKGEKRVKPPDSYICGFHCVAKHIFRFFLIYFISGL